MSGDPWRFQRWAFDATTGNSTRKSVLSMLAMMADMNTGRCEAKQDTLAKGVEASERSVRAHLGALEQQGFIARRAQFRVDRGRRGDEYLLLAPGVDTWPDGERIVRVQPAGLADGSESSGGTESPQAPAGSCTPPGVSKLPGKNNRQGTTTENSEEEKRADRREKIPDDFPDALRPHAREVMRILRAVAEQHGARKVWPQKVALVVMAHPRHALVAQAHKLAAWAVDAKRPIKDVVSTYQGFLDRDGELAAVERLADDGTPSAGQAAGATNVHPIRASNRNGKPTHSELISELRATNPRLKAKQAALTERT